jgi:hypothetical protein
MLAAGGERHVADRAPLRSDGARPGGKSTLTKPFDVQLRTSPVLRLAALRRLHLHVGALIAPSLLFFASTGAMQLFDLHQARGDYRPAPFIEKLSMVHKDQVFLIRAKPKPKPKPAVGATTGQASAAEPAPHRRGPKLPALILKWWFLAVAAGLTGSTLLGLWMALRYRAHRTTVSVLLIVGTVIPAILTMI